MKKLFISVFALLALASCSSDDAVTVTNPETNTPPPVAVSGIFGTQANPLNVGGPNQQNQVYADLSGQTSATVTRDSWDLGFYAGNDFRIVLNGSLGMAVKKLETTDITLAQQENAMVAVGTFDASNLAFVDNPVGNLDGTAFGVLATNQADAHVYLLNLGYSVPNTPPSETGAVNTAGAPRGWKKMKVWAEGNGYKMQFANLNDADYTEVAIAKNVAYNHIFYSLVNKAEVQAEPQKDKWDIKFTTFTNEVFQGGVSAGSYFFSDFVVTNTKAGVTAYKAEGGEAVFTAFTRADVNNGLFSTDQRAIGANWRDVITRQVFDNVFFILKDGEGKVYKIRFISMLDTNGNRGYPLFQYQELQ